VTLVALILSVIVDNRVRRGDRSFVTPQGLPI
jgi:hypothetical protein